MQHEFQNGKSAIRNIVAGLAWVFGLLLAGSDGNLMPWTNIAGVLLFGAAGWYMAAGEVRFCRKRKKAPRFQRQTQPSAAADAIRRNCPAHAAFLLGHTS